MCLLLFIKSLKNIFLFFVLTISCNLYAQDTLTGKTLDEISISVNKWEQKINEIPNKIIKINKIEILRNNPQTAADLLGQTGTVFIQKSQLGGGSPIIRGFATNRVLLVFDGVRLNNAIYRSGNLQNVISIDALSVETAEVIFGPGSLIYGSDAIGGVMDFHSLSPRLSKDKKMLSGGSALLRYSTANRENTIHADINIGWKKWSFLSSVTYSNFYDLKMGKKGGYDSYLRKEYVERINGIDSIVKNTEPQLQRFSGYEQFNFLQKIRFKPSDNFDLQYSFIQSKTGNAPRYDRLIQYRNQKLRYAEWYYGPMNLNIHIMQIALGKKNRVYDAARVIASFQDYKESRIERTLSSIMRNRQDERVEAISANFDATKSVGREQIFYGIEYVHNRVGSTGIKTNINNGFQSPLISRYPDGSRTNSSSMYGSYKININPKTTLSTGLRYSYNTLYASFDTTFIKFPYQKAALKEGGLTGSLGLVFRPDEKWQLNSNISSGYRMPNVDDIGKLFESVPGRVSVPNPDLKSEYAWNFEVGIVNNIPGKLRIELNTFYTILNDAIVRRAFTFNSQDSIFFGGTISRVEALQNIANAIVYGLQFSSEVYITKALSLQTHANWIKGVETADEKNEQVPLRHAPPFYGSTLIKYRLNKLCAEASAIYNSKINNNNLPPSEQAKTEIYAKDQNGKPFSPAWFTINLKTSYQATKNLLVTTCWENVMNQQYRPYSSGIVSAGSNFIVSLRVAM